MNETIKDIQKHHIAAATGLPYKSVNAAQKALVQKKLNALEYDIVEMGNSRFVLSPKGMDTDGVVQQPAIPGEQTLMSSEPVVMPDTPSEPVFAPTVAINQPKKKAPPVSSVAVNPNDRYVKVRFNDRQTQYQPIDVVLIHNGNPLTIQRGKDVIIPIKYKEVAEHATRPVFTHIPGEGRKRRGSIQEFPFQELGPATKTEYLAQKAAGNKITKENIAKFGYEYAPEE